MLMLLVAAGATAQQAPKDVNYLPEYTVSLENPPRPARTPDGQPMSYSSLTNLTGNTRDSLPVEALLLTVNAVGPTDWQRLRQLRSLRLLAIFVPDTMALELDSLLLNVAGLPRLEALRISSFTPTLKRNRPPRATDTTSLTPQRPVQQPPVIPVAGFASLRELRLSGDKIPAYVLIGRFCGHPSLQRVELWGGWQLPQKTLPDNLSCLPNLTTLLVNGRGWQAWEAAFRGLTGLRSLYLSSVSAGGPPARSHDEGNPVIKAYEDRHVADLNRGLAQLTRLQQLDISSVTQTAQLRLGELPSLTHLRLQHVTPGDMMFRGMEALEHLTLEDCYLTSLPTAVCSLSRLTSLNLVQQSANRDEAGTQLLLSACVSRLTSLTALTITNYPIRRLPLQAGELPRLRHVQLAACQLDTIPPFLSSLRALTYLDLQGNAITSIPDTIRGWWQLHSLNLSSNRLTRLPDFLSQLKQLRVLAVGGNHISRLPNRLGDLDSLRRLVIGDNALTALPPSLGRLRRLQSLTIAKNQLTELPNWLGQLIDLTDLSCDMPLRKLPISLLKMRKLATLTLLNTHLRTLPAGISSLAQLRYIRLESDEIRTLPQGFGRLLNLIGLAIHGEKFSRLPTSFGWLSKLNNLTIKGCRTRDAAVLGSLVRLPASLVNCQKLATLTLTDQSQLDVAALFGQLVKLSALRYVNLTGDSIRTLPPMPWASLRWRSLRLANNDLILPPSELAQIPDLQLLDLQGNPLPALLNHSFHNHTMIQAALLSAPVNR